VVRSSGSATLSTRLLTLAAEGGIGFAARSRLARSAVESRLDARSAASSPVADSNMAAPGPFAGIARIE